MDQIAMWIGYATMAAAGICGVAVAVIGASIISNKAQHAAVDSVGGWETFIEYRDWLSEKRISEKIDALHK